MPSSHPPVWRKWAGEGQCALTFLGSLRVSSSLWACKPIFCYSVFLSYWKSSSQQLSSEGCMPCTYFYDFLDFLFLPVYSVLFQAQHTQVGLVYIGDASGENQSCCQSRADDGTSDSSFLLRSVVEQCTAFCYAAFVRCEMVPVNTSGGQSSSRVCAITCGVCLWTFSKSAVFFSWLISAILRNYI